MEQPEFEVIIWNMNQPGIKINNYTRATGNSTENLVSGDNPRYGFETNE